MRGRRGWVALLATAVLALGACSSSPPPQPAPEPRTTAPVQTPTPTPEAVPTWPLTGLPVEDGEQRPAVAVKVENSAAARPQTGLEEADVVWEEMVEGGITRFNAVFHSRLPEVVGPIRSLRPMDAGIVAPLGGPQVISGGQTLFLGSVEAEGVQLISNDAGHGGFFRSPDRRAPHNLYGRPADFVVQAAATEPPPEQFVHAPTPEEATAALDGEPAGTLRVRFPSASPEWTWDATSARWLRAEDGAPAESADGTRLAAHNVVVMRVEIVASAGRDQSGAAVPETVMTGTGEALVASGGRTVAATWSKPTVASPVTLTTPDGEAVALTPGTTWVELVPADRGGVDVER